MSINERIRKVRKTLDLTQAAFGQRIRLKGNSVALIEGGRNTSEQTIFSICKEFNVSEHWLRTGEGEMFVPRSREEELSVAVERLLSGESSEWRKRLVIALSRFSSSDWERLERELRFILDGEFPAEATANPAPPSLNKPLNEMTEDELVQHTTATVKAERASEEATGGEPSDLPSGNSATA